MSLASTNSLNQADSFSLGPVKMQIKDFTALSGDTTGTVTCDNLITLSNILLADGSIHFTAAPTFSGNVATLAFTVPAETQASLVVQDLTYTAVANLGAAGNDITIAYIAGGTTGSEVVTVTGSAISVSMHTGVSTATQIKAAIDASPAALALISVAVSGTGATAQVAAAATPLTSGVTGGARGSLIGLGK